MGPGLESRHKNESWGFSAMPPVKTVASSTDVDNDATAELPVLDVAAYESTLADSIASTDTWATPAALPAMAPAMTLAAASDATAQLPLISAEAIPTLRPAETESAVDLSGTHEIPAFAKTNKVVKATPVTPNPATAPAARVLPVSTPVTLPPHPPLIEELRGALAAAERRVEELNARARIADAERSVAVALVSAENAQLREQLGQHLELLHTARGRLDVQSAEQPGLEDELSARAERIGALERELVAHAVTLADVRVSLDASEERALRLDADVANLLAALTRRESQVAVLEADMGARQEREAALRARLDEALASLEPSVPALRARVAAGDAQLRSLEAALAAAQALAAEKNADLEVAEESIRHLEIEVRDKTGKLEEANVTVEEWRAVIAESQRSILQRDNRIQQLEADLEKRIAAMSDRASQTGEEVALEGPARVLIRTDGNTDFVHVLGRRTRIGRGADNELVIEAKHISRHHAVLLAGPAHTTIEDLNSTNGVFVNGKRVARQALKDGDRVTVGKTHFRYSVRT
jgi:FHA domain